ncbi:sensor histidine kinase [Paenibacillus sacheonensis]|uniref:HAMP domain-containing protein n=1 Tax=Paenibacillus sacheonensis TaxID=742054 RepID=A0A7X4YPR8_9BACL|nr:histidine kinase [Paenibacillus sacheonensis]NBC70301.1 HAMP domain-containing protein [Paenibacillus sacheonensis]
MHIWNRMTIFPKLVFTFLIVIIPLVTICLLINFRSERLVRQEITRSMQDKVSYYMHALEFDFGSLVKLQQQYVSDDDIMNLAYASIILSNEEYTQTIKNIQKKLLIMENMNAFVKDAFVNIPALDRKVSAYDYDPIAPGEAAAFNRIVDPSGSPFVFYEGSLWLIHPYPETPPVGKGFTLGLEISGPELKQSLAGFLLNGEGGAMLADDAFHWSETGGRIPVDTASIQDLIKQRVGEGKTSGYEVIPGKRTDYYAFYEKSAPLGLTLSIVVDERSFIGPIRQYTAWLWWIAIASVLIVLLFSHRLYRIIHTPLRRLVTAFRKVEIGDLSARLSDGSKDEFNYLFLQFNKMIGRLQELIDEVYVQKYQVKVAELKQLQSQINPHFLYNSFFILHRLAKLREHDKVIDFSKYLGDYFKYVTKNADFVRLEQEVSFCKSYVAIQSIRFETHIQVEIGEMPERLRELRVPKLFLQPLLENCYNHGLEDCVTGGMIRMRFADGGDCLVITVEDNGTEMTGEKLAAISAILAGPDRMSDSEGLRNVQQRLKLNYGENAGLTAKASELGGLLMTVTISAQKENDHAPTDYRGQ